MRNLLWLCALLPLAACGSFTTPAAVRFADGTTMIGSTTAAVSGGHFEVATANQSTKCSGTYDALDQSPTIIVPVTCSDGRYGRATVTRAPDGLSGRGFVETSDGQTGQVAFGNNAGLILQAPTPEPSVAANAFPSAAAGTLYPPPPAQRIASASPPSYSAIGAASFPARPSSGTVSTSSRVYTGNCPTPDSYDAAGKRCGARSASSRAGGYSGYGSYSTSRRPSYGGTTYVRGHYRSGRWVSGHTRRSRR